MYVYKEYDNKAVANQLGKFKPLESYERQWESFKRQNLLQAVVEGFFDGILILTSQGELLHINESARCAIKKLNGLVNDKQQIPNEIWRVCESLIESQELFTQENISIESEVEVNQSLKLRIRARWLDVNEDTKDFLLVTLEDRYQTQKSIAIADAKKYGLTSRETEVWLLRRENLSYQEIAERLYITINTVKKHLKSIYAKQQ